MCVVDRDRTIVEVVANKTLEHEGHPDHRALAGGSARAGVFGFSDGLVSNVSLIIGFAAGGVDSSVVRLAGIAAAVAGAASMAAGEWVSISAQNELVEREMALELRELKCTQKQKHLNSPRCIANMGCHASKPPRRQKKLCATPNAP